VTNVGTPFGIGTVSGTVTFAGEAGFDTLRVLDDTVTPSALEPEAIGDDWLIEGQNVFDDGFLVADGAASTERLEVLGLEGDDRFDAWSLGEWDEVVLSGGQGNDTIVINAPVGDGTYRATGETTFDGGPGNDNVSIIGSNGNDAIQLTTGEAAGFVEVTGFESRNVFGNGGDDTIELLDFTGIDANGQPVGDATFVNAGPGNDTVRLGGGTIDFIGTVLGDAGFDRVELVGNGSNAAASDTQISTTSNRTSFRVASAAGASGPAADVAVDDQVEQVDLLLGDADDSIVAAGVQANTTVDVDAGGGINTLRVDGNAGPSQSFDGTLRGVGSFETVGFDDSTNAQAGSYSVSADDEVLLQRGGSSGRLAVGDGSREVVLRTGGGDDIIAVEGEFPGGLRLFGGDGFDDYFINGRAISTPAEVNDDTAILLDDDTVGVLDIDSNGELSPADGIEFVEITEGFAVDPDGLFDIGNTGVIVNILGLDLQSIRDLINAARGITSSDAEDVEQGTVATANQDGLGTPSYGSVTLAFPTSAVIVATLFGDANLDRRVNLADFGRLRGGFGNAGTFASGDFNGDGIVNLADFGLLRGTFGRAYGEAPSLFADERL
jgi:hypothetical protein